MKLETLSSFGSSITLATALSACSMIPLNPDAGVDAGENEAGVSMTDAGVPQITDQIEKVIAAAEAVLKNAPVTEENYARYTVENPLVDEPFKPSYEEYNSSVRISSFGKTGNSEAGIYVRTYDKEASTIFYDHMFARVQNVQQPLAPEFKISIYTDKCTVPSPTDALTLSFDAQRLECDSDSYSVTTITFSVSHGDANAQDALVSDMGAAEYPYAVEGCHYSYSAGRTPDAYGNLTNTPLHTTDLLPGDAFCSDSAIAVIEKLNSVLEDHKVCSPILSNFATRNVEEDTCL